MTVAVPSLPRLLQLANLALPDLDSIARSSGAIQRFRQVASGLELLELCLLQALHNGSLRTTAALFAAAHRPITDVAVLYRLGRAAPFLRELLARVMADDATIPLRAVDASVLVSPGGSTSDWRLHLVLGIARDGVRPVAVELTPGAGRGNGEQLTRAAHPPGSLLLADRGLTTAAQIAGARDAGLRVLLRAALHNLALYAPDGGERLVAEALLAQARELDVGDCREWPVEVRVKGREQPIALRLIALRQTPTAANREQTRSARRASRNGHRRQASTAQQGEWLWLVTDVPAEEYDARECAQLYRVRWQIETYFKHLKSDLGLDQLRARQRSQVETWVLTKLLVAVLTSRLQRDLFPLG